MLRARQDLSARLTADFVLLTALFRSRSAWLSETLSRTPFNQENSRSMSRYGDSNFRDRLTRASEAKQATLAKFRQALDPGTPEAMEKRRHRESIAAARAERNAKRETARQERERELAKQTILAAQVAAEAERAAVERATREAAEQAELEVALRAEEAERQASLEVEQKAKRDARYAARKAARKRRRRGL